MGYQVGNQCFSTLVQAENHYFSLVVPAATPDGRLVRPEHQNGQWFMNGQLLQAQLPECDPAQRFAEGVELGWLVFGVMASMFVFTIIIKMLR